MNFDEILETAFVKELPILVIGFRTVYFLLCFYNSFGEPEKFTWGLPDSK